MAHTCPICGSLCHCGGDIDDLDFGERWDCEHCPYDEDEDEIYGDGFDDRDDDDPNDSRNL